ncbi:MAG: endonuclease/exonuclease/phosphatase family protein [Deltaproteobacteria bacterium]|nr:endonuclease/exonuclease/phosphatase family protein [Deltaproteobacteria bacterium]
METRSLGSASLLGGPPPRPGRARRLLVWGMALGPLALLLCATGAARIDLSPPAALAAVVLVLPWLWGGLAAVGILAALVCRRVPLLVLGLATATCAAVLYGPAWVPVRDRSGTDVVTVMTWNVHRLGWYARPAVRASALAEAMACVVEAVEDTGTDLLVLQEVDRVRLDRLRDRLGFTCEFVDYYATGRNDAGGVAACARPPWTLSMSRSLELTHPWHSLFAEARSGEATLNLLAVHLTPWDIGARDVEDAATALARGRTRPLTVLAQEAEMTARTQGQALDRLAQGLVRLRDPTVVAGDFNAPPDAAIHAALRAHLTDAWALSGCGYGATRRIGGFFPLRVDYVYLTRPPLGVRDVRVLEVECSDHRPVVARIFRS